MKYHLQKAKGAFNELTINEIRAFNKKLNDLDMQINIEKKMEKSD